MRRNSLSLYAKRDVKSIVCAKEIDSLVGGAV